MVIFIYYPPPFFKTNIKYYLVVDNSSFNDSTDELAN